MEPNDVVLLQEYLRRFGYFKPSQLKDRKADQQGLAALPIGMTIGRLDEPTTTALRQLQNQFRITESGKLDETTFEVIECVRCANSDPHPLAATAQGRWEQRDLKFWMSSDLPIDQPFIDVHSEILHAFSVWSETGLFTFEEVENEETAHIAIGWRDSNDPDFNMIGRTIAHADFPPYPPEAAEIVDHPPVPLHFDFTESWALGQETGRYDIRTVAIHEIGHCLGCQHASNPGSVMYPSFKTNHIRHALHETDVDTLRAIYNPT